MHNFCDLRNQKMCLKIWKSAKAELAAAAAAAPLSSSGVVEYPHVVVTFKFSLIFKVKFLLEIYYCKTILILI